LFVIISPLASKADMLPIKKLRAGLPPYAVAEKIVRHNDQVVNGKHGFESLQPPNTPHLIWLADCDARVQATLFYPDPIDTVYTVRNPGNQFLLSAGAIDYGVNELFTPVLLITGNTNNDSLRLFAKGYSHLSADLRRDLDMLRLSLGESAPDHEAGAKTELLLVEKNVDFQVATAVKRYEQRIDRGRLTVIGGVIDLSNQYGLGHNRLIIININGETDLEKLRSMHHLTRLDKRLLDLVGRKPWTEEKNQNNKADNIPKKSPGKL